MELLQNEPLTAKQLARRVGICERQVYRYICVLIKKGKITEEDGKYRLK
jgi:sugar-specific transcriptional regulator TrmB